MKWTAKIQGANSWREILYNRQPRKKGMPQLNAQYTPNQRRQALERLVEMGARLSPITLRRVRHELGLADLPGGETFLFRLRQVIDMHDERLRKKAEEKKRALTFEERMKGAKSI